MKLIVDALVIVLLLCCLAADVEKIGSNLSCYGIVKTTCITMGFSRDQLFSMRKSFHKDSNKYISVLKENGLFKFCGPRGCRAGNKVKNKIHKIST